MHSDWHVALDRRAGHTTGEEHKLTQPDERDQQIASLRDRLSKLTEASLRINESLDVEAALQGVMDGARSVAGAPYSLITTLDASGQVED